MVEQAYKAELKRIWNVFWLSDGDEALKNGSVLHRFFEGIREPDSEDYYLWGLSIYSLNQKDAIIESHGLFLSALEKDPDEYPARLYSAHCFHDVGNYQDALSEYLKVDQSLLKSELPIWRWVKLLEQIGFCYAKTNRVEQAEDYFEMVVDAYRSIEPNELVPVQEAYECLSEKHKLVAALRDAEEFHFR